MPFITGKEKTGGRKRGIPNKGTSLVRVFCDYIADSGYEKFKLELDKLEGKEYVDAFLRLARYSIGDDTRLMANKKMLEILNRKIKHNGINNSKQSK